MSKPAEPQKDFYMPVEIHFNNNKFEDPIRWAAISEVGFGTDIHPGKMGIKTFRRQQNGGYEEDMGHPLPQLGITQLSIISDLKEYVKEHMQGREIALKVVDEKDKTIKTLNYEQATQYLGKLEKLHRSRGHALEEMKELITFASQDDGSIGAYDNAGLASFSKQHGMKLLYKDMEGKEDQISIQDIKSGKTLGVVKGVNIETRQIGSRD